METKTVSLTLAGVTREVVIERLSPKHVWRCTAPIVCKFRSGRKLHTHRWVSVHERDGGFKVASVAVICNRNAFPVAWADEAPGNSGWTNNSI